MQQAAIEAEVGDKFEMNLKGIRQCIIGHDVKQAQDILAVVTAKRVRMIEERRDHAYD